MKKYFRFLCVIARAIPKPNFSNVTFWRHRESRWLYICMSESHIQEEKKFLELFPKAIRVSQLEFDINVFFRPDIEVITVADDTIQAILEDEHQTEERKIEEAFTRGDIPEQTFPFPND